MRQTTSNRRNRHKGKYWKESYLESDMTNAHLEQALELGDNEEPGIY